ncbi:MAG: outer membrane protein assembly factor BamA [Paracoccaceae bacterium]
MTKAQGAARRLNRKTGVGVALIAAGALATAALAQAFSFSTVSVQGNQRIEDSTILSYAGINRNAAVSPAELNDAYQRILASGLFETVEIVPRGNRLVIRVEEYPTVNLINFEGNARLGDDTLAALVQSQSRRVFNPGVAEQDATRIAEAYAQAGRLAARVQPRVIRRSDNRVDLVFEVFEGGVVEVERISFTGNDTFSDRRLRRILESKQAGLFRQIIQRDTFVPDRIEFDKQLLRDFYQARGYIDFRITGVNAELSEARDGYFVNFSVEEGQQFAIGAVQVQSDLPEVDTALFQSVLKAGSGRVYSPSIIETEVVRLERLATREGLNFVRVAPRVTRNDRDLTLDVTYELTRGPRVFVERIDIEGNTTTLDQVIRRQFNTVEGDPFNPRAVRNAAERIRALGFFSAADVNARQGSSPQQVVVDVDVEEQPTGSLSFGGTYSTSEGFGLAVDFSERNFLGRGQQLSLGVSTTSQDRRYQFRFAEPAFLGRDVRFATNLSYTQSDSSSAEFDSEAATISPSFSFPLTESTRLSLRYSADFADITAASSAGTIITNEAARGDVWQHSVGYNLSFDSRRLGLDPNDGVKLEFGQDFGMDDRDATFIKTRFLASAQTRVLSEEVTLRATLEGGALSYSGGGSRVTDRFFMGSRTMRGFELGGLGPREVNGTVDDALGGNLYAVARFEAEFPLPLPDEYGISGGVFYDVGSLWGLDQSNANTLYEDFTPRHVIGASIFWDTAIGPLRFNFTRALQKEASDKTQDFELTISTRF